MSKIPVGAVSELYHVARCIHSILKEGVPVESEYLEQLADALEGINMVTGWEDQFDEALASQLSKITYLAGLT